MAVVENGSRFWFLEAEQQPQNGRFARPGRPYERDKLVRIDGQGHIAQDKRPVLRIPEGYVTHLDGTAQFTWIRFRLVYFWQRLQHRLDPLVGRDDLQHLRKGRGERDSIAEKLDERGV